ncbi:MAG TPA: methionyl-tRNA formyltransferase [Myxococcales bacterium]|jgi:methionyl-tRNA formyltransferase
MRIVFLGTPDFTLPILDACARAGDLVLVVAQPDKPVGRHAELKPPPSKVWALERGIRVEQPAKVKNGALAAVLASAQADVAVVAAYGRILPSDALTTPRLGCLNVHASLLPELRGAAPAQWAVARQYAETGVTIMQMDEGLDTGDIRLQKRLAIAPDETGGSLLTRLGPLGAEALTEALALLERGALPRIPQDHARATHAPLLSRDEGRVDWTMSAQELDARRRGFTPWPGVFTTVHGAVLKIHEARPVRAEGTPGELLGDAVVACGQGSGWQLIEVQPEGKKRMPAAAWLSGARLPAKFRLGTD